MLDQNVPNPLAKNPNFHTHKVFASIGLILIVLIIIVGGVWYFVQSAEDKAGTTDETTLTKVATSSAKTATTSSNSKITLVTATPNKSDLPFKVPSNWYQGVTFGEGSESGGYLSVDYSNYKGDSGDTGVYQEDTKKDFILFRYELNNIAGTQDTESEEYKFFKSLEVGKTGTYSNVVYKKLANTTVDSVEAFEIQSETDYKRHDGTTKEIRVVTLYFKKFNGKFISTIKLTISDYSDQPINTITDYLDQIAPTFKFL